MFFSCFKSKIVPPISKFYKKINRYQRLLSTYISTQSDSFYKGIIKVFLHFLLKLFYSSYDKLFKEYEKYCQTYNNSNLVDKMMFRTSFNEIKKLKKKWFDETIEVDFEGKKYPAPKYYDNVLRAYYGDDYLTPKKEKNMHGDVIFDANVSYDKIIAKKRKEK